MRALALVLLSGCLVGDPLAPEVSAHKTKGGAPDSAGAGDTFFASGSQDTSGPFFQSLGTNGRTCGSCHDQNTGWTITPAGVQARFYQTMGTDPIFRTNDGSVSPNADVSTVAARRNAYWMLLQKGLIRVGIGIPSGAEFSLVAVDDPYGFASAAQLSLFRRPLPSTNLPFLSTVMWDGRENKSPFDLNASLTQQATDATMGHAQATGTDPGQMSAIVAFESQVFTTQIIDNAAGPLPSGPDDLANQPFHLGINDVLSPGFDPHVFTLFDSWANVDAQDVRSRHQASIYRGEQIFNTRPIAITGVKGLNDALGKPTIAGTCTSCHDTPNVGDHSVALPLDLGLTDASQRTSDMPLYTLRNNTTGETVQTTDPGRALITGKWADIGKFKGPILRALAMRAPYFHNGSAAALDDVVDFYNTRFNLGLSDQDHTDLVAFLSAL